MAELFPNALPRPAEGTDVAYTPDHVARALVEVLRPEQIVGARVWEDQRPAWVVSNPPFSLLYGDEAGLVKGTVTPCHLRVLLDVATEGVALLVVGQSLACGSRDWLWDVAVPDEMLWIRERIAFQGPGRDGGKTDMREYAWVIWRKRAGSWMGRGLIGRVSTETGRVWRGRSA